MDGIGEMILSFFDNLEVIEKSVAGWASVGKVIASIGAYIYIFKKFGTKIISGEVFDISDIGYPFFIAFLLSVYTPAAKGLQNIFTESYSVSAISADINSMHTKISDKNKREDEKMEDSESRAIIGITEGSSAAANEYMQKADAINAQDLENRKEEMGFLERGFTKVVTGINQAIYKAFMTLLELCCVIAMAVLFILAKTYLMFLYVFGPLSIGMSLIPSFENSISNWFQKYISYCLWFPIGGTVVELTQAMASTMFENTGGGAGTPGIFIIALAIMIVLFLSIPKMASNIIAVSAGSSGTSRTIKSAARMIATKGVLK